MQEESFAPPNRRYVEGLLAQNNLVIEEIYEKYLDPIIRLVTQNSGSKSDAKDVYHEGLTIMYEQICKGFVIEDNKFGGYLYSICRNFWLNELKKKQRHILVTKNDLNVLEDEEDTLVLAEEIKARQKRSELFWKKFEQLGARCQEILRLNWAGNKLMKVAELMNIDYNYVRKRKMECVQRLIQLIEADSAFNHLKPDHDG